MTTNTDVHELEDATIRFVTGSSGGHWIAIEGGGCVVTLHLPAGPRIRHAMLSRLRLAIDAADEEALREVVEDNTDAMARLTNEDALVASRRARGECLVHGAVCHPVWHR